MSGAALVVTVTKKNHQFINQYPCGLSMHGMHWGIYVHIYRQYLSQKAQRDSLFPSIPWSRIPVVMQGQTPATPQQRVEKEEFVFPGQKLENLTE